MDLCLSVACAACITKGGERYADLQSLPQRSLCGLHRLWGVHPAERHHLCLSVACAACIGKCSQNADRTFVDYAVSW